MASAEQLAAMNIQMAASQDQIATLSAAIESLRTDSSNAIRELRTLLADEKAKSSASKRSEKPLTFINSKNFEGASSRGPSSKTLGLGARR